MPEITELLEQAAPGDAGAAPLDDIVRRGRRRKVATRAAAVGAPLAVVVVVAVIMTGGSPTGVVIDPPPPMAETPDPDPAPTPTTPIETGEPTPGEGGEAAEPLDTSGWLQPSGLAADLLVVEADGGEPQVVRLGADGSLEGLMLPDGVPNAAGLLPDGRGGFVWQPDWESAAPAPVLHRSADGHVSVVAESPADGEFFLVGWDEGLGRPLAELRTGTTMEGATSDLVALAIDGPDHQVVRSDIGGWETGISHAVAREAAALYDLFAEANQFVVLDPPDRDQQVVYEAGEITGENVSGVALMPDDDVGVALINRMAGLDGDPAARLLFIDLGTGAIVDEADVPLGEGFEGDAPWPGTTVRDISVQGDHLLVNRWFEGTWVAPLAYDTVSREWTLLEHVDGGPVLGRAFLAAPTQAGSATGQAACMTEDQHLANAEPLIDRISLYLPCKDQSRPGFVYRVPSGIEPTGNVDVDLAAALEALVEPLLEDEDLLARGYYLPADRGQPVLHSASVEDGHAVVDLGLPNGVGNLSGSFIGAVWSNALRGTVFQFPAIETLEFRLDGSCEAHSELFYGLPDECPVFDRETAAPWTTGFGA